MKITNLALKMLAMVVSSCRTFDAKKVGNLKYLLGCVQSGEDFNWLEFRSGLPEKSRMYDYIDGFMRINKIKLIDEQAVINFFGGIDHIQFTLDQVNALALWKRNDNFDAKYLFGHMLTSVEITQVRPVVCGKYMVGGREVKVRGLIVHPLADVKFHAHGLYLTHFATVIALASKEATSWTRREHMKSPEFIQAMSRIEILDYRDFWAMHEWTLDMLKECGF
jgi:hypothetical protein